MKKDIYLTSISPSTYFLSYYGSDVFFAYYKFFETKFTRELVLCDKDDNHLVSFSSLKFISYFLKEIEKIQNPNNIEKFNFQIAVDEMKNGEILTNSYQQYSDDIKTSFEFSKGVLIFKKDGKAQNKNLTFSELTESCWFKIK